MKLSNLLINIGLAIFAISMIVRYTIYKIPTVPTIIIVCISIALILIGAILRYKQN